ncbi:MAG: DUF4286 family protein [Candidatus Pacebacteria bacterium]|nr:DUF4286 family protein [Candidatus Paceibacterota bacterium]
MKKIVNTIMIVVNPDFVSQFKFWMENDQMPKVVAAIGEGASASLIAMDVTIESDKHTFMVQYEFPNQEAYNIYIDGKGKEMSQRFKDKVVVFGNERAAVKSRMLGEQLVRI